MLINNDVRDQKASAGSCGLRMAGTFCAPIATITTSNDALLRSVLQSHDQARVR
jgi:hypothetical protein